MFLLFHKLIPVPVKSRAVVRMDEDEMMTGESGKEENKA
jgi:hypothetical protein